MTASAAPSTAGPIRPTIAVPMRNGLGIAALSCGLVGILVGFIPLMFLAADALGILAIVFGIIGIRRVARREASNRITAIVGLVAGVAALAMAIWGMSIMVSGLNQLVSELNSTTASGNAPASLHAVIHFIHRSEFVGNFITVPLPRG